MIYNSLRVLPKVVQVDIWDTKNVLLLDSEPKDPSSYTDEDIKKMVEIWEAMDQEFHQRFNKVQSTKIFTILREIEYLENKYNIIQLTLDSLYKTYTEEGVEILSKYGYKVDLNDYDNSLQQISRESEAIHTKIKIVSSQLPKRDEMDNKKSSEQLILAMGGFVSVLGVDFDFYTVSVEKYHALESQVDAKIKSLEKSIEKSKIK